MEEEIKKVLEKILEKLDEMNKKLESPKNKKMVSLEKSSPSSKTEDFENPYKILASKINVEKQLIEDYFEIKEEINIFYKIKRDSPIEEQALFLLAYLTINKICFEESDINSGKLRNILSEKQISLSSLSTNMKKISKYIVHRINKKGSTKTSYRITKEGISKGIFILGEIVKGIKSSDIDMNFLNIKIKSKNNSKLGLEIEKILKEGFFNEYKSVTETVVEMHKRKFFNRRQDVDSYLRNSLLGKKLLRKNIENKWKYVIKK